MAGSFSSQNFTSQNLTSQDFTSQNLASQNLTSQNFTSQNFTSQSQNLASQNFLTFSSGHGNPFEEVSPYAISHRQEDTAEIKAKIDEAVQQIRKRPHVLQDEPMQFISEYCTSASLPAVSALADLILHQKDCNIVEEALTILLKIDIQKDQNEVDQKAALNTFTRITSSVSSYTWDRLPTLSRNKEKHERGAVHPSRMRRSSVDSGNVPSSHRRAMASHTPVVPAASPSVETVASKTRRAIIQCLNHAESGIRKLATTAVFDGRYHLHNDSVRVAEAVFAMIDSSERLSVIRDGAFLMGAMEPGDDDAIRELLRLIHHQDTLVVSRALLSLARVAYPKSHTVVSHITPLKKHWSADIRLSLAQCAKQLYSETRDEERLSLLVSLAGDTEQAVVGSALQGLCPALPRLFNTLQYDISEQAHLKASAEDCEKMLPQLIEDSDQNIALGASVDKITTGIMEQYLLWFHQVASLDFVQEARFDTRTFACFHQTLGFIHQVCEGLRSILSMDLSISETNRTTANTVADRLEEIRDRERDPKERLNMPLLEAVTAIDDLGVKTLVSTLNRDVFVQVERASRARRETEERLERDKNNMDKATERILRRQTLCEEIANALRSGAAHRDPTIRLLIVESLLNGGGSEQLIHLSGQILADASSIVREGAVVSLMHVLRTSGRQSRLHRMEAALVQVLVDFEEAAGRVYAQREWDNGAGTWERMKSVERGEDWSGWGTEEGEERLKDGANAALQDTESRLEFLVSSLTTFMNSDDVNEVLAPLRLRLSSDIPEVRRAALNLLGPRAEIDDSALLAALPSLLVDSTWSVRAAALHAAANLKVSSSSYSRLLASILARRSNPDAEVRANLVIAVAVFVSQHKELALQLRNGGSSLVAEGIRQMLIEYGDSDPEESVQESAHRALHLLFEMESNTLDEQEVMDQLQRKNNVPELQDDTES